MSTFFSPGPTLDREYTKCRDDNHFPERREFVEALWSRYESFCPDRTFLEEARLHFHERTWEMYLACVLLDRGYTLAKRRVGVAGPDICILDGERRLWVEAKAVKSGTGQDRVLSAAERGRSHRRPDGSCRVLYAPPSPDSLTLRYTSALKDKRDALARYRRKGIVEPDEPYVVAVSFAQIEDADEMCSDPRGYPSFVRSLFGIGNPFIEQPIMSDEPATTGYHTQVAAIKRCGEPISMTSFAWEECADVAGIFCSCTKITRAPTKLGAEIGFVNNPFSATPIAAGTFKFGMEYVADRESVYPPIHHDV